ncbi:MAG: diguanylate cyclase [Candidatus Solibacter usitatus]|nr:diguanylate cyclase [Candidatus Solibacter usitatus]
MGAIELQVFVSLVVILGAAFVALICDFLKGSNEQLREVNIELRVRQDEREKREEIIERVQKQTLDVVAQAQRLASPRAAQAANPSLKLAAQAQPAGRAYPAAPAAEPQEVDTRELFERAQRERSSRARRRQAPPVAEPAAHPQSEGATWAQEVFLRRYPHPAPATAAVDASPPVEPAAAPIREVVEPAVASTREPVLEPKELAPQLALGAAPVAPAVHSSVPAVEAAPAMVQAAAPALAGAVPPVGLGLSTTLAAVESGPAVIAVAARPQTPAPIEAELPTQVPSAAIPVDAPVEAPLSPGAPQSAELPAAVLDQAEVVRIKVLRDEDAAAVAGEFSELAGLLSQPDVAAAPETDSLAHPAIAAGPFSGPAPAVPVLAVQPDAVEPAVVPESLEEIAQPAAPPAETVETLFWEPEVVVLAAAVEPQTVAEPIKAAEPAVADNQAGELLPLGFDSQEALPEARTNVVQMPVSRPVDGQTPGRSAETQSELLIPGGFHEAAAFVRLLEEDLPFTGLALALSVVDYVRLLADQGKPAMEQLMASVTRLVMSLAREQDFACRISEDEFILIFGRETGAAAKRRIQLVSERLWDFQLRSLGSVSVIFSWGAAESHSQPVVHAVENAREQMQETRRNRRALSNVSSRFRRRIATD